MPLRQIRQSQAIAGALTNLYRIEALAYAIESMTDELHVFTGNEPPIEGLTKEKSNAIYQLSGIMQDMAVQSQNLLLDDQED